MVPSSRLTSNPTDHVEVQTTVPIGISKLNVPRRNGLAGVGDQMGETPGWRICPEVFPPDRGTFFIDIDVVVKAIAVQAVKTFRQWIRVCLREDHEWMEKK
jgi:hypothetical protein